jgi:DNA-binding PadR family transcriptional regulator
MASVDPESFLPLKSDLLLILLVLTRRERHGYGIIRDVEDRSGGEIRLATGALYRALTRLLADHLIEERRMARDKEKGGP